MIGLLNSYLSGGGSGPIVVPVYGVAGSPSPLYSTNSINDAVVLTTLSSASNATAQLLDDGWDTGGTVSEYSARLTHTDPSMFLHGYQVAIEPSAASTTIEFGLYKIPNGTLAVSNSNVPVLVSATVVSSVFEYTAGFGMPMSRYVPLPAPVALEAGSYLMARSGLSGTNGQVKIRSYGLSSTLPASAAWTTNSAATTLPSSWPTANDTPVSGPYWMHTVMAPNDLNPPVSLLTFKTDRSTLKLSGSNTQGYIETTFTLENDITGKRALVMPVSITASAIRVPSKIEVDGLDGTVFIDSASISGRRGIIGMWGASAGLTAGVHTVRITFSTTGGSDYLGTLNWFECDNVDQNFDNHFFAGIGAATSSTSIARISAPGTNRYYDAFFGSCMGGTLSAPTYPNNNGIWGRYGEVGILSGTTGYPPGQVGLIPTLPQPWGLCYAMGGTSAHVFVYVLIARSPS